MREAAATYRRTLLLALQQTDAAYLAAGGSTEQIAALQRASAAAEAAVGQARTLYGAGLTGLLNVLDARRTALALGLIDDAQPG
jgi:outer membrane protein TolC